MAVKANMGTYKKTHRNEGDLRICERQTIGELQGKGKCGERLGEERKGK